MRAEDSNQFRGVELCRNGPALSHLLFVDLLIMLRASKKDALSNAKIFFKIIAEWSGEEVKFQKSGIFFLNASYQN